MDELPDPAQYAIPAFIILILIEMLVARRIDPSRYEPKDTLTSLLLGTGSTVAGSVNPLGTSTINATMPIISRGAVSPNARAMPIMVPVSMPGKARGNTW